MIYFLRKRIHSFAIIIPQNGSSKFTFFYDGIEIKIADWNHRILQLFESEIFFKQKPFDFYKPLKRSKDLRLLDGLKVELWVHSLERVEITSSCGVIARQISSSLRCGQKWNDSVTDLENSDLDWTRSRERSYPLFLLVYLYWS